MHLISIKYIHKESALTDVIHWHFLERWPWRKGVVNGILTYEWATYTAILCLQPKETEPSSLHKLKMHRQSHCDLKTHDGEPSKGLPFSLLTHIHIHTHVSSSTWMNGMMVGLSFPQKDQLRLSEENVLSALNSTHSNKWISPLSTTELGGIRGLGIHHWRLKQRPL